MLSSKRIKVFCDLLKSNSEFKLITDHEDVLQEILLKLPIEVLLTFKCVSKQWLSIISDPLFGYLHFRGNSDMNFVAGLLLYRLTQPHHPKCAFVRLEGPRNMDPLRSLTSVDANSDIHRISSCHGLLCLCIIRYGELGSFDYYICNPTTNKSIKLPDLERPLESRILSMTIAFDPYKSGFYKVVCVSIVGMHYRFSTYSSETKNWRDAGTVLEMRNEDHYLFKRGVFWNNSVHWVSKVGPFLRFDTDKECLETMPATPIPSKSKRRWIRYFGEFNGHLHLIEVRGSEISVMDILEMKRDYSEWILRHRVDFDRLSGALPGRGGYWMFNIQCYFPLENEPDRICLLLSTATRIYMLQLSNNHFEGARRLYRDENDVLLEYKWYRCHLHIMTLTAV